VGRLPQAGEGSEPHRAKKLVVPLLLHDELVVPVIENDRNF
jgi:hypothetical protein